MYSFCRSSPLVDDVNEFSEKLHPTLICKCYCEQSFIYGVQYYIVSSVAKIIIFLYLFQYVCDLIVCYNVVCCIVPGL